MNDIITKVEYLYTTKNSFTAKDCVYIDKLIDSYQIDTDDIKQFIMNYIYIELEKLSNKYDNQDIWSFTDENICDALTAKENYNNLLQYLKKEPLPIITLINKI